MWRDKWAYWSGEGPSALIHEMYETKGERKDKVKRDRICGAVWVYNHTCYKWQFLIKRDGSKKHSREPSLLYIVEGI